MLINIIEHIKFGSCLLWVMSTEISVDKAVNIAVDSRSIVGRWSVDSRSIVGRQSVNSEIDYWRKVGKVSVNEKLYRPRHIWNDYRSCLDRVSTHYRPTINRYVDRLSTAMSTDCQSSVDQVLTECRLSIDRLSTECQPTIDRVSTAISTDISVDITHSKQDLLLVVVTQWQFLYC